MSEDEVEGIEAIRVVTAGDAYKIVAQLYALSMTLKLIAPGLAPLIAILEEIHLDLVHKVIDNLRAVGCSRSEIITMGEKITQEEIKKNTELLRHF